MPTARMVLSRSQRCSVNRRVVGRSEEHTSELQSRLHLVCRLLLEKKKSYPLIVLAQPPKAVPAVSSPGHTKPLYPCPHVMLDSVTPRCSCVLRPGRCNLDARTPAT